MTFHHDVDGVAEARWLAAPGLADLPRLALPSADTRIVVLAAHPDDETLGAGGLIAAAGRAGHEVVVVLASAGEASHPDSSAVSAAGLALIRREEALRAMAVLADAAQVVLLGRPDGALAEHVPAITDALRTALGPGPAWLLTTWRDDAHPDHAACSAAGRVAAAERADVRHFEYPIWWWHWGDPGLGAAAWPGGRRFELDPSDQASKQNALDCYRSQTEPLGPAGGDAAVLTVSMLAHFDRDFELLFDVGGHAAADPVYFADLYAEQDDPWHLGERHYEERKRSIMMAALPRRRFRRAFEPGCANGDLSVALVERCEALVCQDVAPAALARTAARLGDRPSVTTIAGRIPEDWPAGEFDLIVLAEVGYYCPDLVRLADEIDRSLTDDGYVVLVHWRWPATDHPHTAESVHETVRARTGLEVVVEHIEKDFLLHVLGRSARSVAQVEGIVA